MLDIDECVEQTHNCSGDAHCNNTAGNYTCECFSGFEGDGFNCPGSLRMVTAMFCMLVGNSL